MDSEQLNAGEETGYKIKIEGPMGFEDLREAFIDVDDQVSIHSIVFEIDSSFSHLPVKISPIGSATAEGGQDVIEIEETSTVSQESTDDVEINIDEGGDDDEEELEIRPNHDPYFIMHLLIESDGWLRTNEILENLDEDWGVSEDSIQTTMWQLHDRDLVEKRKYEEDKRQREFTPTEKGEREFIRSMERVGDDGAIGLESASVSPE